MNNKGNLASPAHKRKKISISLSLIQPSQSRTLFQFKSVLEITSSATANFNYQPFLVQVRVFMNCDLAKPLKSCSVNVP